MLITPVFCICDCGVIVFMFVIVFKVCLINGSYSLYADVITGSAINIKFAMWRGSR